MKDIKELLLKIITNKFLVLFFCFLVVFLIFGLSIGHDFVFDDIGVVRDRVELRQVGNIPNFFLSPYSAPESGAYRPLTVLSFSLNYFLFTPFALWGQTPAPWSFHLINIILHILNGWLLFLLIKKLSQRKLLAWLTCLLFLVLPIHVEAVAGIVGRAELLTLGFSLLVFLSLFCLESRIWKTLLGSSCFLLALLSKENAVAVLPIYFFIVLYSGLRSLRKYSLGQKIRFTFARVWPQFLGLISAFFIYFGLRLLVLKNNLFSNHATIVENPLKFASIGQRILTAFKILTLYLEKTFWPVQLSSDYSYNQISLVKNGLDLRMWLGIIAFSFFIFCLFKPFKNSGQKWFLLGISASFFIWPFLPIANLLFPIGTIMAERLMYFPSIGLCLILAYILLHLRKLKPKKVFLPIFFIILFGFLFFYSVRSYSRNLDWHNEKMLFVSAVKASPNSVLSRSNKGAMYLLEGKYEEAEKEILAAHQIYPFYPHAMNNLGLIYRHQGKYDLAEQQFLATIETSPGYINAYENLALVYFDQAKYQLAREILLKRYLNNEDLVNSHLVRLFETRIRIAQIAGREDMVNQLIEQINQLVEPTN